MNSVSLKRILVKIFKTISTYKTQLFKTLSITNKCNITIKILISYIYLKKSYICGQN